MTSLLAMHVSELEAELGSRARAIAAARWLHGGALRDALPASVPGVSRRVWEPFVKTVALEAPKVLARQRSEDGTTKYALEFGGARVETVRIPAKNRSTICVSSQAGCTRRCVFCSTKELGFVRNLTAGEMVAQYALARSEAPADAPARNVVFMGMGEPFDNLDQVLQAVRVLTQSPAPQLKAQSVTVSTSGVLPGLQRFLKESKASLALSLNATEDETRAKLMPHTRTWPIAALLGELEADAARNPRREHFIEYVVFDGVNDSLDDARRLVKLLAKVRARVNLIPFNAGQARPPHPPLRGTVSRWERDALRPPSEEQLLRFQAVLVEAKMLCLIRWPRGREIAAACGQLALTTGPQLA